MVCYRKQRRYHLLRFILLLIMVLAFRAFPLQTEKNGHRQEEILHAARKIMKSVTYCVLITIDDRGKAYARLMEPLPPENDFTVWLGTNPNSRKVTQIRANPQVTLFYSAPEGSGYVSLMGTAFLIDDAAEKTRHWKENWEMFYPDRKESFLLIKVVPQRIEVVSYPDRLVGDSLTWEAPAVNLPLK